MNSFDLPMKVLSASRPNHGHTAGTVADLDVSTGDAQNRIGVRMAKTNSVAWPENRRKSLKMLIDPVWLQ